MWQRIRWWILGLVVAVAAGFLLGRAGSGPTAAEKKSADSLAAVARAADAQVAAAKREQAREDSIAADSIRKAKARVIVLRGKTDTAWLALDTSKVTAPVRALLDTAKADLKAERIASDAHVRALEADTLTKKLHADSAWMWVTRITKQRNDAQDQLAAALARRAEPPVTLGASGGGGCVLHNGAVVCGPGAAAGLTLRVKVPVPRWFPRWLGGG